MSTASDVIREAASHIGYVEGPRDNETVFGARIGFNFQPWCGSFVMCVLQDAGVNGEPSSVYAPAGAEAYMRLGRWIGRNGPVQPGDVVFFDWQGGTSSAGVDHVGIVELVRSDGSIQTIEGNTSATSAGSQSNGGQVARRVRPRSVIAGFGRPAYSGTPAVVSPPVTEEQRLAFRRYAAAISRNNLSRVSGTFQVGARSDAVRLIQNSINVATGRSLAEDGAFGPATLAAVRDLQKIMGLTVDGVVGPKTLDALRFLLGQISKTG